MIGQAFNIITIWSYYCIYYSSIPEWSDLFQCNLKAFRLHWNKTCHINWPLAVLFFFHTSVLFCLALRLTLSAWAKTYVPSKKIQFITPAVMRNYSSTRFYHMSIVGVLWSHVYLRFMIIMIHNTFALVRCNKVAGSQLLFS
jgi:hypothetical protein